MGKDPDKGSVVDDLFEQYQKHASDLRNWFVVYGVGGIALFFTETDRFARLPDYTRTRIMGAFLITVAAQVSLAFLNKWIHWCTYRGAEVPAFGQTYRYAFAKWLSNRAIVDFVLDLLSLLAASFAVVMLIHGLDTSAQTEPTPPDPNLSSMLEHYFLAGGDSLVAVASS